MNYQRLEEMEAAAKEAFPNGADGPTGKLLEDHAALIKEVRTHLRIIEARFERCRKDDIAAKKNQLAGISRKGRGKNMPTIKCHSCRTDSGVVRGRGYTKSLAAIGWMYRQNKYGVRCYCKNCVDAAFSSPAVVAAFAALVNPKRKTEEV